MLCACNTFSLDRPFPLKSPVLTGHAGSSVFFLPGGALCVAAFFPDPPAQMVAAWGGQLSYGVFVHDGVPFVVIFFRQGGLSLNPGINILSEVEAGRSTYKEFLDADSKAVALTLVDSVSNSVRATRTISFSEPALSILRQVCRKQLDAGTALDIRASIWETTETCESSTMLLLSQAHGNLPAEQQNCRNC